MSSPSESETTTPAAFKVVIPARFAATRLPGKPLVDIGGRPLIAHVWARAIASGADEVVIATDDARIEAACRAFGAQTAMTSADHPSGSDRVGEVMRRRGWAAQTIVVNLQGDEPCLPAMLIDQVAALLAGHPDIGIATLSTPIDTVADLFDPNTVKVVTSAAGRALYFSRAPMPWPRDAFLRDRSILPTEPIFQRHIGLYAYRVGTLARFLAWPPAPLERAESLEQLRALWHGEPILVAEAAAPMGPGVDTPDDIAAVLDWLGLARGGEAR